MMAFMGGVAHSAFGCSGVSHVYDGRRHTQYEYPVLTQSAIACATGMFILKPKSTTTKTRMSS